MGDFGFSPGSFHGTSFDAADSGDPQLTGA
jgi:hypothetical protein